MNRVRLEKIIGAASELVLELLSAIWTVDEVNDEDDDGGNRNNGQAVPGEKFTS